VSSTALFRYGCRSTADEDGDGKPKKTIEMVAWGCADFGRSRFGGGWRTNVAIRQNSKLIGDQAGKVLKLLLVCRCKCAHITKKELETNFALEDMQPMTSVEISLVADSGYRRWRAIKLLQPSE
jgi:hypothetical protein